jgi:outer membrane protein OmpA-like peptidoglycan-associated protein
MSTLSNSRHARCAAFVLAAAALVATGCADMSPRQQGTAGGAAAGAVAGAVIGRGTGGSAGGGAVVGGVVGAVAGNLWSKHMEDKRRALAQASAGTGIKVERTADNRLRLDVPSDASFDVNSADIKAQLRPVLDEVGRNLDPKVTLSVVGHTDNTGSDAINDPLSRQRAESVRNYLSARGIPSQRIAVAGRGSHEPVSGNDSEAGRAANRRVEIYLVEAAG